MSVDLESQLQVLGASWDAALVDVDAAEAVRRSESAPGDVDGPAPVHPRPDRRWLLAVAAALVLVLVGSLAVLRRDDPPPAPPVDQPATSLPSPTTSAPTPTDVETDDPTDGRSWPAFVPTGRLVAACWRCDAVQLPDGPVLVVGAAGADGTSAGPAQWYDPVTESFTVAELEDVAPYASGVTVLPDGRLALFDPSSIVLFSNADRATETIDDVGSVVGSVGDVVVTSSGDVVVVGGSGVATLDLGAGSVRAGVSLPNRLAPAGLVAVPLADGSVLFGGQLDDGSGFGGIGRYVPATGTVEAVPSLDQVTELGPMVDLPGGRVMAIGRVDGRPEWTVFVSTVPDPSSFRAVAEVSGDVDLAAVLPDGRVLVLTGESTANGPARSLLIDPAGGSSVTDGPPPSGRREGGAAVTLADGRVLVLGGNDDPGPLMTDGRDTAELFSLGPFDRPAGCCDPIGEQVNVSGDVPQDQTADADAAIGPVVVVPAGAAEGLASAAFSWGDPRGGGSAGGGPIAVPADCVAGCELEVPLRFAARGSVDRSAAVYVGLHYEGAAPVDPSSIRVEFRPVDCDGCILDG